MRILAFILGLWFSHVANCEFITPAKQAILIDAGSGMILFEKNAYEPMAPSSMTKIMTIYMVFEALSQGRLSLEDTVLISKNAWKQEGSRMFVEPGSWVKVKDLISGTIVSSGNDSSYAFAELLGGTIENFAKQMTKKAESLGTKVTIFKNPNGLPDEGHQSSAFDLALIALRTIENFPSYYKQFYSQTSFSYNNITQKNQNNLLYLNLGADGLKTGHTVIGGYGLTASAIQGDMRLVLVVNGLQSSEERSQAVKDLMTWGFRNYATKLIFEKDEVLGELAIQSGTQMNVPVMAGEKLFITKERYGSISNLRIRNLANMAPIEKGKIVGYLQVTESSKQNAFEIPLIAVNSVKQAGWFQQLARFIKAIFVSDDTHHRVNSFESSLTSRIQEAFTNYASAP